MHFPLKKKVTFQSPFRVWKMCGFPVEKDSFFLRSQGRTSLLRVHIGAKNVPDDDCNVRDSFF